MSKYYSHGGNKIKAMKVIQVGEVLPEDLEFENIDLCSYICSGQSVEMYTSCFACYIAQISSVFDQFCHWCICAFFVHTQGWQIYS